MSDTTHVQNLIIGSGQAGNPLAGWLTKAAQNVVLVERDRVGGSCVNYGCTPTKTMVASARTAYMARRARDYGVNVDAASVKVDMTVVRDRKRKIVEQWSGGSEQGLLRNEKIELIYGEASFSGKREVSIALRDGGTRTIRADRVFINTGTRNFIPPIEGLADVPYLDNETIMELDAVPQHLLVLGGGYIGLEFSQMFRRFGAEVSVIEASPRFLRLEDEDIAESVVKKLTADGLDLVCCTRITRASKADNGAITLAYSDDDGNEKTISGSHLLVAAGRRPNTDMLNLAAAGVDADDRGFIKVNGKLETSAEGVWALGDCKGGPAFTHISYNDGLIVKKNLLEGASESIDNRIVPYTMYIDPQLGRVGLSETQAREQGRNIKVASMPMGRVARAAESDETTGVMKAIVDADTDRILGAAVFGIEGGEIMSLIQTAMLGDMPYTILRDAPYAHPTLAESMNNLFARFR